MKTNVVPIFANASYHGAARVEKDAVRPFRLWDARRKCNVRWRYYSTARKAMDSALLLVRWEKVGCTYEVYDARTMRHLGTYIRKADTISFTSGS